MKLTGFLLLLAGWIIVLAAIALLPHRPAEIGFVMAALAVQALGLTLVFRAHLLPSRERR
jgi:hypothetical protein